MGEDFCVFDLGFFDCFFILMGVLFCLIFLVVENKIFVIVLRWVNLCGIRML